MRTPHLSWPFVLRQLTLLLVRCWLTLISWFRKRVLLFKLSNNSLTSALSPCIQHTCSRSLSFSAPVRLSRPCSTSSGFFVIFPLISSSSPTILSVKPCGCSSSKLVSEKRQGRNLLVPVGTPDRAPQLPHVFAAGDLHLVGTEMELRWKIRSTFVGCLRPLQNVR